MKKNNSVERRDHAIENVETRTCSEIELRKDKDGKIVGLRGYAAVFDSLSENFGGWREVVDKGAFKADLENSADVRALVDHDTGRVIGRTAAGTLKLKEDDHGLAVSIDLPDTSDARDLAANIAAGNVDGMSFGFRVRNAIWEEREEFDVRHLKDVELLEVSAVAFPAYPATSIAKRSHHDFRTAKKSKAKRLKSITEARRLDLLEKEIIN